ncbi:interleukin-12 subunit beta [Odontesthes bonariensis]|uniref:interleukin-12 subunit beta n=1 Tax=Odontesthes bonariensis TaxID=219752 RepID=UPI003F5815AA
MHLLFLILLCAGLCCASTDSHLDNLETLMDNVVVLRVPHIQGTMVEVPLTCGGAYQSMSVLWKKNGKELTPALRGNQVKVLVKEMNGGNYTCHLSSNGDYLNHTTIMVQLDPDNRTVILEEKSPEEGHIHCSAPNYNGSFHCTWTRTQFRSHAAVLLVKAERLMEDLLHSFHCVMDADGSGVHCLHANCPYQEEQHRIALTVYMHSYSRLEAYTKSFYLREIVRPAMLQNLHVSNGKVFSWEYPDSWEKPCTFFGLHFQVKTVPSGHSCSSEELIANSTTDKTEYEVSVRTKRYVFCVRAQDKFTMGPWSYWSQCVVNKHDVKC